MRLCMGELNAKNSENPHSKAIFSAAHAAVRSPLNELTKRRTYDDRLDGKNSQS